MVLDREGDWQRQREWIAASQLAPYKAALADEVKASVQLEPGVLTLYAVAEKDRPTHFTILEIYADRAAYEKHIKSPHFLKYKVDTEHMVKSLELIDAIPLVPAMKINEDGARSLGFVRSRRCHVFDQAYCIGTK